MPNPNAAHNRGLLNELKRLAKSVEAGDFDFTLNAKNLSEEEAETVFLLYKVFKEKRATHEYDLMTYKLTCQSMGMVMWDMDVVDGDPLNPKNQIRWSPELRRNLGFNDENDFPDVFASWIDRLHPEDKDRAVNFCIEHILDRTGNQANEAVDLEFRVLHKDGKYRHFLAFGATQRAEDGTPLREAGAWLDITKTKEMEQQIVDMNENLTFILDSMPVGISIVCLESNELCYANKASMNIFGCQDFERDLAGKTPFDFMPEIQPNGRTTIEMAKEFFASDKTSMDFQYFRLNGEPFTARITSCNINYKGKPASLAIIADVTEQTQAEEQFKRHKTMMDTLNEASAIFVSRNEDTFEANMTAGVTPIADIAAVDRLSIWRNFKAEDGLHASMVYRWDKASGGTTKPTDVFTDVTYPQYAPNWEKTFSEKQSANGPARLMPEREAITLKAFGVVSVFAVPVFVENVFWGFVFYEDRYNERYFDADCADMLRYAAFLLVNAAIRYETERKIAETERRGKLMLETSPLASHIWDSDINLIDCNEVGVKLYGFKDKKEYKDRFFDCSPEYQPDGQRSYDKAVTLIDQVLKEGRSVVNWQHRNISDGSLVPTEVTLVRVEHEDDYIVFSYNRDMREHNRMMEDIEHRDAMLRAVNSAAEFLLNSDIVSFEAGLQESMRALADAVLVDRVRVWKNHRTDGKLYCTQLYELSENVQKLQGTEHVIDVSYDNTLQGWEEILSGEKCINRIFEEMPLPDQVKLSPQGVVSFLIVPVFIDYQFWGFASFDDCRKKRIFTETEEAIMRSGSLLITNALLRHEMLMGLYDATVQLECALNDANEANKVKSAFLANMSHEIRTPMNSIVGFAELARNDDISDKTRDYLSKISENAKWLLNIINDILDISKIESGKITLEHVPFDLHEIFEHCQSMIMPTVMEKGLSLYCYAEPSVGKKLLGDPVRLQQIITNLLSNAVKFTNSGTIKLLASITSFSNNNATIHFEVKDSGIGMSPDQIETIFEPFTQADAQTTRNYGGIGLGLSIAKNFVELMGGSLKVVSAIGVGSKFSFELPFDLIDVPSMAPLKEVMSSHVENPVFKGEILICEDNYMNQLVVCELLARMGIKTVVAHNGLEGVDMVAARMNKGEKPFDLIFMDIHMPVMDGLEAASKISAMGAKTPIVALTANVMVNNLTLYKTSGMIECLGKPFTTQDLYKCLLRYMTPLNFAVTEKYRRDLSDEKLQYALKLNFVQSNQTTCAEIQQAMTEGDLNLAHRLAHTLKSNAGTLDEKRLWEAAVVVESMLKSKENLPTDEQMRVLGIELNSVLEKYSPMLGDDHPTPRPQIVDETKIRELIDRLEPMLANQNLACMEMLGDIRAIPGTKELVRQIEDFEFEQAVLTLEHFKWKTSKKR